MEIDVYIIIAFTYHGEDADVVDVTFDEDEAKRLVGEVENEKKGIFADYKHFKKTLDLPLFEELPKLFQDIHDLKKAHAEATASLAIVAERMTKLKKASEK